MNKKKPKIIQLNDKEAKDFNDNDKNFKLLAFSKHSLKRANLLCKFGLKFELK